MTSFAIWTIISIFIAISGNSRTIGFAGAFLLSFMFSPFIGIIGIILSPRIGDDSTLQHRSLVAEKKQYENLKRLRDEGVLSQREFIQKRVALLNSYRHRRSHSFKV